MTNLIEKSLLLGFGIFTLAIFSSIVIPFMGKIADFNQNERNELETFIIFTNEIDQGIYYVIHNQNESYLKEIDYPAKLRGRYLQDIENFPYYRIEKTTLLRLRRYTEVELCLCEWNDYWVIASKARTLPNGKWRQDPRYFRWFKDKQKAEGNYQKKIDLKKYRGYQEIKE